MQEPHSPASVRSTTSIESVWTASPPMTVSCDPFRGQEITLPRASRGGAPSNNSEVVSLVRNLRRMKRKLLLQAVQCDNDAMAMSSSSHVPSTSSTHHEASHLRVDNAL